MLWQTQRQRRGQGIRARDLAVQHAERAATGVESELDGVQQFAQLDVERGHIDLGVHALHSTRSVSTTAKSVSSQSWHSQGSKVSQDPAHAPMPANVKFVTGTL
ncbi:hypothetical protein DICSQDRAFT_139481 [Dichomitus squalens LYAD-421 SS1]|uniref:Uncharacterized protein n=1 Tax=Dichomitus squalens (strain LYAD-421) TaxID=732165 RepID=R7SQC6_DICSQ|nr:uncharacterized protein DICSQDRAFT_139481 [Dichomitus squalens LYAD-421 SS1]EJF58399.1 hypothetical protein DICSQDRAFT_139481 [Dichomitus squalens LYAD-421 SS1]